MTGCWLCFTRNPLFRILSAPVNDWLRGKVCAVAHLSNGVHVKLALYRRWCSSAFCTHARLSSWLRCSGLRDVQNTPLHVKHRPIRVGVREWGACRAVQLTARETRACSRVAAGRPVRRDVGSPGVPRETRLPAGVPRGSAETSRRTREVWRLSVACANRWRAISSRGEAGRRDSPLEHAHVPRGTPPTSSALVGSVDSRWSCPATRHASVWGSSTRRFP